MRRHGRSLDPLPPTERAGELAVVQRCQVHELRNALEHLPERLRPSVAQAMHQAWSAADARLARRQIERRAASLEKKHPSENQDGGVLAELQKGFRRGRGHEDVQKLTAALAPDRSA